MVLFSTLLGNHLGGKKPLFFPDLLSRAEMGKEWRRMGRLSSAHLLQAACSQPRGHQHMTEWLVGRPSSAAGPVQAQRGPGRVGLVGRVSCLLQEMLALLVCLPVETLLISERHCGLRRKRTSRFRSRAVNNLFLSPACSRARGQSEGEVLQRKDGSEMQVSDFGAELFEPLVSPRKERPSVVCPCGKSLSVKITGLRKELVAC